MSILKKLFPSAAATIITQDLGRLDKVHPGMGAAAVKYVLTGQPETVLSTLSVHGGGEALDICGRKHFERDRSNIHTKRPALFLDSGSREQAVLVRYATVLAASCKALPNQVLGSNKVPPAMRVFFSEAFLAACDPDGPWPGKDRTTPILGLTPNRLAEVATALGGTNNDLFEMLFAEGSHYETVKSTYFRALSDIKSLVIANPDAAFAGTNRCGAAGRVAFLKSLNDWGLVATDPFLAFVAAQVGDGAKATRDSAIAALRALPAEVVEPIATARLADGKTAVRAGMVEVLLALKTDTALNALKAHAKSEKTARIAAAIDNALSTTQGTAPGDGAVDGPTGYTAIDGTRVDIPPIRPLTTGEKVLPTRADRQALMDLIARDNARITQRNADNAARAKAQTYVYKQPLWTNDFADKTIRFLSGEKPDRNKRHLIVRFTHHLAKDIVVQMLDRMPQDQAMTLAFQTHHSQAYWLSPYAYGPFDLYLQNYLTQPGADLRAVDALWCDFGLNVTLGGWRRQVDRTAIKGDVLRSIIPADSYLGADPLDLSGSALWPYVADNLHVLDQAFGVANDDGAALDPVRALSCVASLPKVPMRHFGPILEIATGERKSGKAEARRLLNDVPEVRDRLETLLSDSRQAVRAGAAEWMGTRGDTSAINPLKTRLKREKSELAKAAILTALQQLGEPLDAFVGPTALIREAEAGLKKAKLDKLQWLGLDAVPGLKFKNGKAVPSEVPRWWLYLAFKLKQPGGNALFDIYLDQLAPASAETLSAWVLDSWLTFDTTVPSDEEANAHAKQYAQQHYQVWTQYEPGYTLEMAYEALRREKKSQYLNSGTATKGILALAGRTAPHLVADRVRGYLRDHGSRTSQASSLLDVLAHKGDPVSLQVVIAAATRLKQKGVQAYAGDLVQAVADRMNWSMDELADRVVPTAGLDDAGVLDLPCGVDEKHYRATLGEDLTFVLTNPEGKGIKGLPSAADEATKAAKKQLTSSKKELKQVIAMQTGRLYEALCGARVWPLADWQRDFRDHPVMRRLTERLVWQGLDAEGTVLASFRPTAEGEYTDADDAPVDPARFANLRVAHGALMATDEGALWETHLKDYDIKPLFAQFGRTLMRLEPDQAKQTLIEDRKGWVLETFQFRGVATKLGYDRGQAEDGGWFYEYRKGFRGVGLTAVISFTGNFLPEENRNAALMSLGFVKDGKRVTHPVPLGEVPQVLLSECWNDYRAMAEKGTFDPEWKKTCEW